MWSTREDVINDLSYSGLPVVNLDSQYIVRAGRPPPRPAPIEVDDEEINLRFGRGYSAEPRTAQKPSPDLVGISNMLRMIRTDDEKENNKSNQRPKKQEYNIVISKLNPNVQEFVPKGARREKFLPKKQPLEAEKEAPVTHPVNPPVANVEKQETLHKTIYTAKHEASLDQKRAKNVAIAALLKRHTTPSNTASSSSIHTPDSASTSLVTSSSPKPVVLFTPDYFSKPAPAPEAIETEHPTSLLTTPERPVLLTPKNTPKEVIHSEIKESINKVEKWLNCPGADEKSRFSRPFLGPVVFKKRDSPCSPGRSPVSDLSSAKETPQITSLPQYQPSKYAEELRQRMEKQAREKESADEKIRMSKMSLGERLEYQLKQRDKEIRAKGRAATNS